MPHRIYPSARERILQIWEYSDRKWGEEQANRYIEGLIGRIDEIALERHLWKSVADPEFEGAYFARYHQHFIFFRELEEGELGVISILHEVMDVPSRLREDAETNDSAGD
ncbi:MAG: toxin ParE1/3/4 [Verrucomicrobiales bacterium]|jgi:toxin ParE1/3/4